MKKIKINFTFEDICAWSIVLSCILLQYKTAIFSYGMLLLLTLTLINIFIHKKLYIDIKLIILWLGIFFQQMISLILFKLDFAIFIKNLFSILLIIIITDVKSSF